MQIYLIDLKKISSSLIEKWQSEADKQKQEEFSKLKIESKRSARIAAEHLRRKAIADFCKVSPDEIKFLKTEKGKPYAIGLPVHFNISHSGDYVVCAVSDKEIGIDIEKIRDVHPRSAERFACPEELEYINSTENGFFEIWTLKEAYFKCIGTGLGSDIKNVSFHIKQNEIKCSEQGFECLFYKIANGYICSICRKI